jgi:hypothetical protein
VNGYSSVSSALKSLLTGLSGYSGLVVSEQHYKPDLLPASFSRYGIIISPSGRPWEERRTGNLEVQYIFRADLMVLVANFDPTNALLGATAPNKGLFEMVSDIKDLIRTSSLGGLLDKTYDEAGGDSRMNGGGPVEFQSTAAPGLDTGNYAVVNRARIPFVGRTQPFCHGRVAS